MKSLSLDILTLKKPYCLILSTLQNPPGGIWCLLPPPIHHLIEPNQTTKGQETTNQPSNYQATSLIPSHSEPTQSHDN
jgi:hypothetical protein